MGTNNPSICSRGTPRDPHQFNQTVLNAYLDHLAKTVALPAQYHVYTLLDMHQDVYSEAFDGEGARTGPCARTVLDRPDTPGRWSKN